MQEENFENLKTSLEIRGFDPSLYPELERNMKEGKPEFILQFVKNLDEDGTVLCQLPFNKGKEDDRYYFNHYQATLVNGDEVMAQVLVKASWKIRVQEAARIMAYGQNVAVYKQNIISYRKNEGEQEAQQVKFNAYITLDPEGKTDEQGNLLLNSYHDNYYAKRPFEIADQLENPEIPFRTKQDYDSVDALIRDIHQAIPVAIIMTRNGKEEDGFLNVNARRGKLNFMDENGISIDTTPAKKEKIEATESQEVKKKPWLNQGPQKAWKPKQNKGISR